MATPILTIAGKDRVLRWGLRAQYRLQSLEKSSTFADLANPDRAVAASLNFGWACLPPSAGIPSPEDLADILDAEADGKGSERLDEALAEAISIAYPGAVGSREAEAKKASTDSSPALASSSV